MFEKRLKNLLIVLAVVAAITIARLIDLQVVHADIYKQQAEQALLRPAKVLPFVRGRLLDRLGNVLAQDAPRWDVCVDYDELVQLAKTSSGDDSDEEFGKLLAELADFGGESKESLRNRALGIEGRIARMRRVVSRRHGYDVSVREERSAHPLLIGLNDQQQVAARERFVGYQYVRIKHGAHRLYHPSPSLGHLLGRLGAVDVEDLRDDPKGDDSLACYLPSDRVGVAGVEHLAERRLRGRRGRYQHDRRGKLIENIAAVDGQDVSLTLRIDLQETLYDLLGEMIEELAPESSGGSIVVLDVPSREALALVSYPGYDANEFRTRYDELRSDTKRTPLRFRAAANSYEPGSIVKPLICIAGLGRGAISLGTQFHCDGYYLEKDHSKYRCWKISGTNRRKAHGSVVVEEAICGSCNIFMYNVADLVGVSGLTAYFEMAGFGQPTGMGLAEAATGINPTPSWLNDRRGVPATAGRARNYAIGQGELTLTPVHVANLMALYASGVRKDVSICRSDTSSPSWELPLRPEQWTAIRKGLFRVTNDPTGTAFRTTRWTNGRYALCGKTGSATTTPRPTAYRVRYTDENRQQLEETIAAGSKSEAVHTFRRRFPNASFDARNDVTLASSWPPPKPKHSGDKHSHAWFAGYLQAVDPDGRPKLNETPPIAFAVLVEFGGSGGHTAGPIAKRVAERISQILGDDLDPDAPLSEETVR